MKVEFVRQTGQRGTDPEIETQRLVNVEPELVDTQQGRSAFILKAATGYSATPLASLELNTRAVIFHQDLIYVVAGGTLFSVAEDGTTALIGAIPDDLDMTIAALDDDLTFAAGGRRLVYDGTSITEPGEGRFRGAGSVTSNDSRIVASQPNGQEFDWTDLDDAKTLDALNFTTKGNKPGNLVRVIASNEDVWAMGESSSETFYTTSNPSNSSEVYDRIPGAVIETGILRRGLAISFHDELFFVGHDKKVYVSSGTQPVEISDGPVRDAINAEAPERIFAYEAASNHYICLWFRNSPARIFKKDLGVWFERTSGARDNTWDIVDTVRAWNNDWYGVTLRGDVVKLEQNQRNGAGFMRRIMRSIVIENDARRFRVRSLQPRIVTGQSGLDRPSAVAVRFSKDGANTWTRWRIIQAANVGEFQNRLIFRGLGSFRAFTFEIEITDDLPLPVESSCIVHFNEG